MGTISFLGWGRLPLFSLPLQPPPLKFRSRGKTRIPFFSEQGLKYLNYIPLNLLKFKKIDKKFKGERLGEP
jgi:hypothetical protein